MFVKGNPDCKKKKMFGHIKRFRRRHLIIQYSNAGTDLGYSNNCDKDNNINKNNNSNLIIVIIITIIKVNVKMKYNFRLKFLQYV